ncbi:uncharacterized protein LOC133320423 [Danaus plexippus]|uniref:uncharacterized protein LOC133320423 n=1 Tax=Danaus plexippus TaxID=13037 RepID=UPI002AB26C53|nr:uncharacterized protein LOC133320423 [Danaus plexippus]
MQRDFGNFWFYTYPSVQGRRRILCGIHGPEGPTVPTKTPAITLLTAWWIDAGISQGMHPRRSGGRPRTATSPRGPTPRDKERPPAWRACLIARGLTPYLSHPSPRGQSPTIHRRAQASNGRQSGDRPSSDPDLRRGLSFRSPHSAANPPLVTDCTGYPVGDGVVTSRRQTRQPWTAASSMG